MQVQCQIFRVGQVLNSGAIILSLDQDKGIFAELFSIEPKLVFYKGHIIHWRRYLKSRDQVVYKFLEKEIGKEKCDQIAYDIISTFSDLGTRVRVQHYYHDSKCTFKNVPFCCQTFGSIFPVDIMSGRYGLSEKAFIKIYSIYHICEDF